MAETSFEVLKPPIINQSNMGRITGRDILPTAIADRLLRAVFTREIWFQALPQWDGSWTYLSTYADVIGALNYINFDDFKDHQLLFEMIGFTDVGTGYYRLFNETTNEPITDSDLSTTTTDSANPSRMRSGVLKKPNGTNMIRVQHRIDGGDGATKYVNSVMARIVFRLP
jgi:hypothetical protein